MNGFLNILKPPGMTSAAVVGAVKRLTGEKRVGHAGTLDPEAAGVLPVMIGQATRLFDFLADKEKTYVAECAFGLATDTQDAQGTVTAESGAVPTAEQVAAAARALTGDIQQRPGAYSAVKRDGKRLYELARAGIEAEAPLRTVHIERIDLHGRTDRGGWMMTVDCGRGTYIRSLCEDMGKLCGCPAHMRFLLRTRSGAFSLDTAMPLEEARELAGQGELAARLLSPDWPLGHLPRLDLPEAWWKKARSGVHLPLALLGEDTETESPVRIYADGHFTGIAAPSREEELLRWRIVMTDET
ncbi:MAG: tRNA pseudouridine(55) synthase TruB [Clostridia bacterium]|nr:tRNA pseudouridine(55) synthase TruB [Clostridia bacterium]